MSFDVLILLGSNRDRANKLMQAKDILHNHPQMTLKQVSPIYESEPVGDISAELFYWNQAVWVTTTLTPIELKAEILRIEHELGRKRVDAVSVIDLDISLYGQEIVTFGRDHIPHRDIPDRAHVAIPLADIAPDWVHPELNRTLQQIADDLDYDPATIHQLTDAEISG